MAESPTNNVAIIGDMGEMNNDPVDVFDVKEEMSIFESDVVFDTSMVYMSGGDGISSPLVALQFTEDSIDLQQSLETCFSSDISQADSMKFPNAFEQHQIDIGQEQQENIAPNVSIVPRTNKQQRWDRNLERRSTKSDFDIQLQHIGLFSNQKSHQNKIRDATSKKQMSIELTSSPHRTQLKVVTADKDIKNIKRTKRLHERSKRKAIDQFEDVLCSICGILFSNSCNGDGWKKCINCSGWYHTECQGIEDKKSSCSLCE